MGSAFHKKKLVLWVSALGELQVCNCGWGLVVYLGRGSIPGKYTWVAQMAWQKGARFITEGLLNQNFSKYKQQTGTLRVTWELGRNQESDSGGLG